MFYSVKHGQSNLGNWVHSWTNQLLCSATFKTKCSTDLSLVWFELKMFWFIYSSRMRVWYQHMKHFDITHTHTHTHTITNYLNSRFFNQSPTYQYKLKCVCFCVCVYMLVCVLLCVCVCVSVFVCLQYKAEPCKDELWAVLLKTPNYTLGDCVCVCVCVCYSVCVQ